MKHLLTLLLLLLPLTPCKIELAQSSRDSMYALTKLI